MANFQKLSPQQQAAILTSPFFVSATMNPELETETQSERICETFSKLSRGKKYKLSLPNTSQKIQLVGKKYGFELLRLANIARLIREYYFNEVRFENFPQEIEKRMGVNLLTAQEITRYLKQAIIDWDPWAEYIAKLPKMTVREIVENHPKIIHMEITAGYVELKNSKDLENPSIKNWIRDYVSHLGYVHHSQMDRTQYLFHSENGKNLNSQDREKLGIILKSFDENIPLSVDEENGEIVFDSMTGDQQSTISSQRPSTISQTQSTPTRQEAFIKPYPAVQPQIQRPAPPTSAPIISAPVPRPLVQRPIASAPAKQSINFTHTPYSTPAVSPQPQPKEDQKLEKYFNMPESSEIPSIRVHSITEHNEPKIAPPVPIRPNIQRPVQQPPIKPQQKIIEPFQKKMIEPRLEGNIVDLSKQ